jgi:hypothetical protein
MLRSYGIMGLHRMTKEELEILKQNDIHDEFHEFLTELAYDIFTLSCDNRKYTYYGILNDICQDFNKCQMKWIDNFCNRNWV